MDKLESLSRQRIDFSEDANGDTLATLTVTLGDGSVRRFTGKSNAAEVDKLAKGIANAELRQMRISGEIAGMGEDEIGSLWGKIVSSVKKVGKVARKIASSKVFKLAAQGIMAAAPALGPFAPAALAVGGGMMVASKLSDASIAAEAGAKRVSRALTGGARRYVRRIARKPSSWRRLLSWGNRRRRGVMARAGGFTGRFTSRRRQPKGRAYWARKRAMVASARRRAQARRRRPSFPRYASPQYAQPRYFAPWGAMQRTMMRG